MTQKLGKNNKTGEKSYYRNKNNILWPIYIIEKCLSRMRIDPEISKQEAMWKLTS